MCSSDLLSSSTLQPDTQRWGFMLTKVMHLLAGAIIVAGSAALDATQVQNLGMDRYPPEALRLHQQGRVVTHLVIKKSGRVKSCTIAESSRSPSLDAAACQTALKRVHFRPAHDAKGKAIESEYDLPLRYVLPDQIKASSGN